MLPVNAIHNNSMASRLLQSGTDATVRDNQGNTPLMVAQKWYNRSLNYRSLTNSRSLIQALKNAGASE
jgi:hypothetical protein